MYVTEVKNWKPNLNITRQVETKEKDEDINT